MLRSPLRRGASLAAAFLMISAVLVSPALAGGFDGTTPDNSNTNTDVGASQQGNSYGVSITITTTKNGVRQGSQSVSAPASSISVPPVCWYEPSTKNGQQTWEYYESGQAAQEAELLGGPIEPPPGLADHQNDGDDKGRYWYGICSSANWPSDDMGAFFDYTNDWFANHPPRWVAVGDPPPPPAVEIPPSVLQRIAYNAMVLDPPNLEHNPVARGVVNLPTWVWADDASFQEQTVRAEFGANWAEVRATPTGLDLTTNAGGSAKVTDVCTDGGRPYRAGGTTDCSVDFHKSSRGGWTVTGTLQWNVAWSGSDGTTNAPLPTPANPSDSFDIPVDEVQTVVNGR